MFTAERMLALCPHANADLLAALAPALQCLGRSRRCRSGNAQDQWAGARWSCRTSRTDGSGKDDLHSDGLDRMTAIPMRRVADIDTDKRPGDFEIVAPNEFNKGDIDFI